MADYTTIDNPAKHFNTVLYTGNSTTDTGITGVGFQPDWVWVKSRGATESHFLNDSVRGAGKNLKSESTAVEGTETQDIKSFDSDGFTLGSNDGVNDSGFNYVSWNWLGANGTTSNGDGSITATVSANQTAGFSIISYTGNATAGATIGHGLGVIPQMVIVKNRDNAQNWFIYHEGIGATKVIYLDLTNAQQTLTQGWNDTAPTSSVVSLGTEAGTNQSGANMIAYCFAEKQGYSKFGKYTGNGSTDGAFVYTGFRPALIITKKTSASGAGWVMIDNKRETFNDGSTNYLLANATTAETNSSFAVDVLSNGFKARTNSGGTNTDGATYIYWAFAEHPFVTVGTKAAGMAR